MDPNLFHLDWERTFEVLVAIVVLAFFVERALSTLFESQGFINMVLKRKINGLKEITAFVVSALVCWYWDFDAVSMVFLKENVTLVGTIITGGIVAGGSKASIKLFRDVMGFRSLAEAKRLDDQAGQAAAKKTDEAKGGPDK